MYIYDAKVNHITNPLGFMMKRTVFSWKVAEAKGTAQKAARILVSKDEAQRDVVFDSGWDEKADSRGYRAEFELEPYTRYYWTVAVRTNFEEEKAEAATSPLQWFETAKREEAWTGKWISCISGEKRHPAFEKKIEPKGAVRRARLYVSGLGLYEAFFDGERIGNEYLTPYSNNYNSWVQYQTFDVTEMVAKVGAGAASGIAGTNVGAGAAAANAGTLVIILGNGWYKSRFGFAARGDVGYYGQEWKLIAELRIEYEDGSVETIGTDDSWTVHRTNITYSGLYDGEHVDGTLEEMPLEKAFYCEPPKGRLCERLSLPVTIRHKFTPEKLIVTPEGEQVFDLGQEITGIFALRVHEKRGTRIHIQTGEVLQQGCFYNANLRSAKSEYWYTSDGNEHTLIPHFTFYGYRYVKVEGVTDLKVEDFTGLCYYSELQSVGEITTGFPLLNRFIENVRWGLQDNFVDVPTDCPQRDERMGWTGDAQVFSPTATYLKDTYAFYAKYLHDMYTEQLEHEGMVPDVIPSAGVHTCACVWGDAATIIPWNLYLFYGDVSILMDQYDSMKAWVDFVRRTDGDDHAWRYRFHYGDWLSLDNPAGGAEQVMGATDEEFIANLYYAVSAGLVAKAARVLGKEAEAAEYQALSDREFDIVKKEYYSVTGRCCIKTQTALLLTLKYHLSANEELTKKQLRTLFEKNKGKLATGFVGTPIMNNVLTEHGMGDIAWELMLNEEYPGWLHEVLLGATTVWERWNSLLDDGSISGISMNSMNHYSYGSVEEWLFRHVVGINSVDEAPGFGRVRIMPTLNWKTRHVSGSYDSASGLYKAGWKLTDPRHAVIHVTVPFGCSAELELPLAPDTVTLENENTGQKSKLCLSENPVLGPGTYKISYKTTESTKQVFDLDTKISTLLKHKEIVDALGKIVPLTSIPGKYLDSSFNDMRKTFPGFSRDALMNKIEEILSKF